MLSYQTLILAWMFQRYTLLYCGCTWGLANSLTKFVGKVNRFSGRGFTELDTTQNIPILDIKLQRKLLYTSKIWVVCSNPALDIKTSWFTVIWLPSFFLIAILYSLIWKAPSLSPVLFFERHFNGFVCNCIYMPLA